MTPDVPAEAEEAAARAAKAAGVAVRELATLTELEAAIALFDEVWVPEAGNSSVRLDLLRALTKAGNYASGAYDLASGQLLGACVGFFGPPSHAELHSHIAGVRPAGLGRSVGFTLKVHQRAWCLRRGVRSSPGPTTRSSGATRTSTWSSLGRSRSSTCATSTA